MSGVPVAELRRLAETLNTLRGHAVLNAVLRSDLRQLRLKDLREQIAVVFQDPVLFPDTVAANIAVARPDAPPSEIQAAARAAHAETAPRHGPAVQAVAAPGAASAGGASRSARRSTPT